jgi:tritrans,polycis-undecaprenyl-diphosphate synthase [geranylgeranyl-diphosphate specific]
LQIKEVIYSFAKNVARKILYNKLVYNIYEKVLWYQIKDENKPEHIGVILDGNRRWAAEHSKLPWAGHRYGADKLNEFLNWCLELGTKTITLYAFSTENFTRPQKEVNEILVLLEDRLNNVVSDERIHNYEVQIKVIGRINLLPENMQNIIRKVEEDTRKYSQNYLNVAIAYGGRAEIIDAAKKIAEKAKMGTLSIEDINEKVMEDHLYTAHLPQSDPDLVIRTSGEERLSGFLLWQSAYSELYFSDVFWPELRRIDLWRAIRTYQKRERRRGR